MKDKKKHTHVADERLMNCIGYQGGNNLSGVRIWERESRL